MPGIKMVWSRVSVVVSVRQCLQLPVILLLTTTTTAALRIIRSFQQDLAIQDDPKPKTLYICVFINHDHSNIPTVKLQLVS